MLALSSDLTASAAASLAVWFVRFEPVAFVWRAGRPVRRLN